MTAQPLTAQLFHADVGQATQHGTFPLPNGEMLSIALTLRLETPGECCADIASTLAYAYEPPLPDDVAVRFDDRLYDGVYAGFAEAPGALPPAGLKVAITELCCEPPLATVVSPPDWPLIGELAQSMERLAVAAFLVAWDELQAKLT